MLKKILMIIGGLVAVIAVAFTVRLVMMAKESPNVVNKNKGMENGHLKACSDKPNCVSTQAEKGTDFYIEPLSAENIEGLWDDLNVALKDLGLTLHHSGEDYMHCIAKTKLLGFIDDVEFKLDRDKGVIEMRSESRVGYSDLGANRKRLEKIRKSLQPQG